MARPILIDCDPGKDDAVAIWFATASPELDVRAVSTVGGNVGLGNTTRNALTVLDLAGRPDVPVHAGCPYPLLRPLETAVRVHGTSGMDGADLVPSTRAASGRYGPVALVEAILAAPRPPTIAALGPVTNLAVALTLEPGLAGKVERIVVMGGGFDEANMTAFAEFNVYVDPHAAAKVFACGAPITLVPLDVTRRVLATEAWLAGLEASGRMAARAVAGMYRASPDLALHDPCVMAWLVRPDLFVARAAHVTVVTDGPEVGRTVQSASGAPNMDVLVEVDGPGVRALIAERLGAVP